MREASAQHPHRWRPGGAGGQLAVAGQRALVQRSLLRSLADQQPVGPVGRPLLPKVSGAARSSGQESRKELRQVSQAGRVTIQRKRLTFLRLAFLLVSGKVQEQRLLTAGTAGPEGAEKYLALLAVLQ